MRALRGRRENLNLRSSLIDLHLRTQTCHPRLRLRQTRLQSLVHRIPIGFYVLSQFGPCGLCFLLPREQVLLLPDRPLPLCCLNVAHRLRRRLRHCRPVLHFVRQFRLLLKQPCQPTHFSNCFGPIALLRPPLRRLFHRLRRVLYEPSHHLLHLQLSPREQNFIWSHRHFAALPARRLHAKQHALGRACRMSGLLHNRHLEPIYPAYSDVHGNRTYALRRARPLVEQFVQILAQYAPTLKLELAQVSRVQEAGHHFLCQSKILQHPKIRLRRLPTPLGAHQQGQTHFKLRRFHRAFHHQWHRPPRTFARSVQLLPACIKTHQPVVW